MKRFIFSLVAILFAVQASGMEKAPKTKELTLEPQSMFPGVFKINDDLYVGKVNDGFYMAMERINKDNIQQWLNYAEFQNKMGETKALKTLEGSCFFLAAINNYTEGSFDEVWVAYASRSQITTKADLNCSQPKSCYNPDIEMFMSVITSRWAFITSHMGIARSAEAELDLNQRPPSRKKQPLQSIHLHSFAAKVMLLKNRSRRYMLTRPVPVMREIIVKNMPVNTVFVGDNLYQQDVIKKIKNFPYCPKNALQGGIVVLQQKNESLIEFKGRQNEANSLNKEIAMLKNNPPRITLINSAFSIPFDPKRPLGDAIFFDQSNKTYRWMYTDPFTPDEEGLDTPYTLIDLNALAHAKGLMDTYK